MYYERSKHGICYLLDGIYVLGGENNDSSYTCTNTFEKYDISKKQWIKLSSAPAR
jgi:hypothetical protein